MFVNSTLLGSLDRLNIKSILTSSTGSILGFLGTLTFLILIFIIYLGPLILFFEGDFIQSSFITQEPLQYQLSTGCDFKMAVTFYHKGTGQIANHTHITEMLDVKVISDEDYWDTYSSNAQSCKQGYFDGLVGDPQLKKNQCFLIPDNLRYKFSYYFGYPNSFGFRMYPICNDPFKCTYQSQYQRQLNERLQTFFDFYYYVVFFTTKTFSDYGHVQLVVNKAFSSNFDLHEDYLANLFPIVHTKKTYMDDTIMPWYNNQTYTFMAWDGFINGQIFQQDWITSLGIGTFIMHYPKTEVVFRYYRKLDWMIGMLGGGIFILFLLFWIPCNYINTVKQKKQICQSLTLSEKQKNADKYQLSNLQKTKIPFTYYLTNLFWFFDKKTDKKVNYSEKLLDIAGLIKKQKVTLRNLKKHQKTLCFQPRQLTFQNQRNQNYQNTPESNLLQIHPNTLNQIKSNKYQGAFQNNLIGLAATQNQVAQKVIKQNMRDQVYHRLESSVEKKKTCWETVVQVFKFFDVFGAKPNLVGSPHHARILSMILTFIIIILAILTFSLTLHNMNKTKTYMDRSYVSPNDLNIKIKSYRDFRMAFCAPSQSFISHPIVGPQRIANLQFFQATRNGTRTTYQYFQSIWMNQEKRNYFQFDQQEERNLNDCFRMPDNKDLQVYGSTQTDEEAYFGVYLSPYCSGTPQYCQLNQEDINTKFYQLINNFYFGLILPENKYSPDKGRIISDAVVQTGNAQQSFDTLVQTSVQQTFQMEIIEIDDDTHNWWIGQIPQPISRTLTSDYTIPNHQTSKKQSQTPFYRYNIKCNGQIQRIILTNYKVDYLFGIVGGCFLFFWMIIACFGRFFNTNRFRKQLAQQLYTENTRGQSCCSFLCYPCPCSESCKKMKKLQQKITNDLDVIGIVKNVDASYRLSSALYPTQIQKNISLIYLKEIIDSDETIAMEEQKQVTVVDTAQYLDFESDVESQKPDFEKKKSIGSAANLNINNQIEKDTVSDIRSDFIPKNLQLQPQYIDGDQQVYKKRSTLQKILGKVDLFSNNNQLTFEGKRTVQSMCGGVTCILFLILTILLVQYFLTIYFSQNQYSISSQTLYNNHQDLTDSDIAKLQLTVGETFKLLVSFMTPLDYRFHNVTQQVKEIGLSMRQIQHKRKDGQVITNVTKTINLVQCPQDYLDGFLSQYDDHQYYKKQNLKLAFCVPDGSKLISYGLPFDQKSQDFMLSIYNKDGTDQGNQKVQAFLNKYITRFHMSSPKQNFRNHDKIDYQMNTYTKANRLVESYSGQFNITLTKIKVDYKTSVLLANQYQSKTLYDYDYQHIIQQGFFVLRPNRSYNVTFNGNQYIKQYTVRQLKADQLFGLIGGVILFLFFGLGVCVKSFNDYRMRYLIGSKLYQLRPSTMPILKQDRTFGKKIPKDEQKKNIKDKMHKRIRWQNNMGEPRIFLAWFLSLIGFIRGNYNFNKTLRQISLIQSRVSEDMNIFNFYKNIFASEKNLQNSKLFSKELQKINFSRVYFKHVVRDQYSQVRLNDEYLEYVARQNDLSDYQLNKIQQAKKCNCPIENIFEEKWLDKTFKIDRRGPKQQEMRRSTDEEKVKNYSPVRSLAGSQRGMKQDL